MPAKRLVADIMTANPVTVTPRNAIRTAINLMREGGYRRLPVVDRGKLVADCTCDGKSPTGLVRLDPREDPTLRPGDFVATGQGLMAYRGGNGASTEFSAISNVPGISANLRTQLSATKVAPGKQPLEEQPDPEADGEALMSRNVNQRSQAAR